MAIPLVVVLRDVSTDGKYIGLLVLLWSMPMSTIFLIMLPKVIAHHQGRQGMTFSERVRGSSAGVRVTGLPDSLADSVRRASDNGRRTSDEAHRGSKGRESDRRVSNESPRATNEQARPSSDAVKTSSDVRSSSADEFAEE